MDPEDLLHFALSNLVKVSMDTTHAQLTIVKYTTSLTFLSRVGLGVDTESFLLVVLSHTYNTCTCVDIDNYYIPNTLNTLPC